MSYQGFFNHVRFALSNSLYWDYLHRHIFLAHMAMMSPDKRRQNVIKVDFPEVRVLHSQPLRNSLPSRRETWYCAEAFVTLSLEQNLAPEFLGILVKPEPELALPSVDVARLQLDRDSLVRFASNNKVLVVWVGLFHLLFVCAHNTDLGGDTRSKVRELELKQQPVLACVRVAYFCDAVSGPANLNNVLLGQHTREESLLAHVVSLAFPLLLRRATCQVCLMLPSLCMREIGSIVLVDCQTETALEAADVVLEEVRVLVKVDGLERELSETLSSVGICRGL
jgi:hypothetical protein